MAIDTRLDHLAPRLSARERAILVLSAGKADRPENPSWRSTMPEDQTREFNRLIGLLNAANGDLVWLMGGLSQLVRELEIRHSWLMSMVFARNRIANLVAELDYTTKEPVTASEYRALLDAKRAEFVSLADLVEVLMERFDGWHARDYEVTDADDEPEVSDVAWLRVEAEKGRELRTLAKRGVLSAKGRGSRLRINIGSFYDWLGAEVPLKPEWGCGYEMFTDAQAELVERLRQERQDLRDSLTQPPLGEDADWLEEPEWPSADEATPPPAGLTHDLRATIRTGIAELWREAVTVERLWEEIGWEFNDEDPAGPRLRQELEAVKTRLLELRNGPCLGLEPVELGEADEELLAAVRDRD